MQEMKALVDDNVIFVFSKNDGESKAAEEFIHKYAKLKEENEMLRGKLNKIGDPLAQVEETRLKLIDAEQQLARANKKIAELERGLRFYGSFDNWSASTVDGGFKHEKIHYLDLEVIRDEKGDVVKEIGGAKARRLLDNRKDLENA